MQYVAKLMLLMIVTIATPLAAQEPAKDKPRDKPKRAEWKSMFDGKTLKPWKVVKGIEYEDHGKVEVNKGCMILGKGQPATGARWPGKFPKMNYEVELEAKRVEGGDFFCGMSFPVGDEALTLILGGWGGWVVGLSCIDSERAVDNETCTSIEFKNDRWYRVRVRVTKPKIQVWVDGELMVDLDREDHKFNVTFEMEPCLPFGIATWNTTGALRKIRYRLVKPETNGKKKQ